MQQQLQMPAQQQNLVYSSASSSTPQTTAKLPKLEVKKFSGKIQEWQEFWDSFKSAIDSNKSLSAVDKFAYLRSLIVEPARSTITGFALTSANYGSLPTDHYARHRFSKLEYGRNARSIFKGTRTQRRP